jgi:hypothetical protein
MAWSHYLAAQGVHLGRISIGYPFVVVAGVFMIHVAKQGHLQISESAGAPTDYLRTSATLGILGNVHICARRQVSLRCCPW